MDRRGRSAILLTATALTPRNDSRFSAEERSQCSMIFAVWSWWNGRQRIIRSHLRQDKGHRAEWEAFSCAIRGGGESPIPFSEIVATTIATLRAVESRSSGQPAQIGLQDFMNSQPRQVTSLLFSVLMCFLRMA